MKIRELSLPGWVLDALYTEGLVDLDKLYPVSAAKVRAIPGIGLRGTAEILAAVLNYHYKGELKPRKPKRRYRRRTNTDVKA